jgi:hypothetical protein
MIRDKKIKQIKIRVTKKTNVYFEKQILKLGKTKSEVVREYIHNTIHNFKSGEVNGRERKTSYSKTLTDTITVKIEENVYIDFLEVLGRMNISMSDHLREHVVSIARLSASDKGLRGKLREYLNAKPMNIKDAGYGTRYMIVCPLTPHKDEDSNNTEMGYGLIQKDFLTQEESYYWIDNIYFKERIDSLKDRITHP